MSMVPSALLLCYFELASRNLQALIDSPSIDNIPSPSEITLDWHRSRIMSAQIHALDEVLLDWNDTNRGDVQAALRHIGEGDYSDENNEQNKLRDMMNKTNDLARKAFANSVLFAEWQFDHRSRISSRSLEADQDLDKIIILEYCALAMSSVQLDYVQQFLEKGGDLFPATIHLQKCNVAEHDMIKIRLEYVQSLIWRALGWDPEFASSQLQQLFSSNDHSRCDVMTEAAVAEALTKYASAMTVVTNNFAAIPKNDDGITRVINVSYSEKIVTVPQSMNNEDTTIASLSAPTSIAMHEHSSVQQRHQLDIAQKTNQLQQQIWDEFEGLSKEEQAETIEKAETVQQQFLENVMNAPPGPERVLLMQSLSGEEQKLLVLHKLWIANQAGSV
jgi:hypothetical protein